MSVCVPARDPPLMESLSCLQGPCRAIQVSLQNLYLGLFAIISSDVIVRVPAPTKSWLRSSPISFPGGRRCPAFFLHSLEYGAWRVPSVTVSAALFPFTRPLLHFVHYKVQKDHLLTNYLDFRNETIRKLKYFISCSAFSYDESLSQYVVLPI